MKKFCATLAATCSLLPLGAAVQAQDELVYVAVEPCRIADTRRAALGVIRAETSRNFRVSGSSNDLAAQGVTEGCDNPKGDQAPVAVAAYILAVPAQSSTGRGVLTAYPSDSPSPPAGAGSTVNFAEEQIIGNTSIVTLCSEDCPDDGQLAILARRTDEHVVIDVQSPVCSGACLYVVLHAVRDAVKCVWSWSTERAMH